MKQTSAFLIENVHKYKPDYRGMAVTFLLKAMSDQDHSLWFCVITKIVLFGAFVVMVIIMEK